MGVGPTRDPLEEPHQNTPQPEDLPMPLGADPNLFELGPLPSVFGLEALSAWRTSPTVTDLIERISQ